MIYVSLLLVIFLASVVGAPGGFAQEEVCVEAQERLPELVKKLSPAVVNISTRRRMEGTDMPFEFRGAPFGNRFFEEFFGRNMPSPRFHSALGSGFIIDETGYIVTNDHVIKEADEITVRLLDGTVLDVTVVGRDERTDLALLKAEVEEPLPVVRFGDSGAVCVGERVFAIGNPFGLGGSVTDGIVSAINRDLNAGPYDDFIQTDAAINRGNSGGPLFNMRGEVIGVNTVIISPSGTSAGLGFAIASSSARRVVDQLRDHGEAQRGWLGVRIQVVTEDIAQSLGLEEPKGALVTSVEDGGPAQRAGLRAGDLILSMDGETIEHVRDLQRKVGEMPVHQRATMVVLREGQEVDLSVVIGRMSQDTPFMRRYRGMEEDSKGLLGMSLSPLSRELRRRYDLDDRVEGVVVTEVESGSAASRKGIRPGDVIVRAGNRQVRDVQDVRSQVEEARTQERPLLLGILRNGMVMFLGLPLNQEK